MNMKYPPEASLDTDPLTARGDHFFFMITEGFFLLRKGIVGNDQLVSGPYGHLLTGL